MYDALTVQELQALEQGVCKPADECYTEPLEVVLLDQFIQVDPVEKKDTS